ncbi:MAG TPA: hypothetical protein VGK10_04370 [Prolixibacteraceae bacterium]
MSYTWVTDDNDRRMGTRKENACLPAPRPTPHASISPPDILTITRRYDVHYQAASS